MKSSVANEVAMKASLVVSMYSGSFLAITCAVDGESIGSVNDCVVVSVSAIFVLTFICFFNFACWYTCRLVESDDDYCLIMLLK